MPILPDPDKLVRQTGSPSLGIQQVRTGDVARAQERAAGMAGQKAEQMGQAIGAVSANVLDMANREQERLDTLQAVDFENRLVDATSKRLIEAQQVKGGDVLKDNFIKRSLDSFDADASALEGGLTNVTQREKAKFIKDKLRSSFGRDVALHAVRQTDELEESRFQGQVNSWTNYAASSPDNPDITRAGVEGVRTAVINKMTKLGADPLDIQTESLKAAGNVHLQTLDALRTAGKIQYANEYLAANSSDMTPEQVEAAKGKLRDVTEQEQGIGLGIQAHNMLLGGATKLEVRDFLDTSGATPGAMAVAERTLKARETAHMEQQQEVKGSIFLTFLDTDKSIVDLKQAISTPEFDALTIEEKFKTRNYLEQVVDQEENRKRILLNAADAAAARAEARLAREERAKENSMENFQRLFDFTEDPDALARMSDARIQALVPELGVTNTKRLLAERNRVRTEGRGAKLDTALVNAAVAEVPKSDANAAKGAIASAFMDWKTDHPGRVPTEEEQINIIRGAQENWVKLGVFGWFNDEDKKSYQVKPGEGYPLFFKDAFPNANDKWRVDTYGAFAAFAENLIKNARKDGKQAPPRDVILEQFKTVKLPNLKNR